MGLFSKKECSVCGGDAGRVFTKKLEDGILCKECASKLSPWFSERRESNVAQVQEQLTYREANKAKVANFQVTRTFNGRYKVLLDENSGKFCVTGTNNWRNENPDILDFTDVTGCSWEVRESKRDVTPPPPHDGPQDGHGGPGGPQGHGGPGGPQGHGGHGGPGGPQGHGGPGGPDSRQRIYEYDYDFYLTINVNNPYFQEIEYQVNDADIHTLNGGDYLSCQSTCEEIKAALTQVRESSRAAAAPKQAVTCSHCGATTMPDAQNCCEYCGGALNA